MWLVPLPFSILVVFLLEFLDAFFVYIYSVKMAQLIKTTMTYNPPVTP